jgi:hypothetical protein
MLNTSDIPPSKLNTGALNSANGNELISSSIIGSVPLIKNMRHPFAGK